MCVVCTTIPAVLAIGVSAQARQNQRKKAAVACGKVPQKPKIAAKPVTATALVLLVLASAWIHSQSYG